jgi:YD repeat-containing protein
MFPHVSCRSTLRTALVLTISASLLLASTVGWSAPVGAQGQSAERHAGKPRRERPEGLLPDLEEAQRESQLEREAQAPIPSTVRSAKVPLEPWNGRRVGDPEARKDGEQGANEAQQARQAHIAPTRHGSQTRRAHARARVSPPPPVLDYAFVQNFFTWTVSRAPSGSELTYWNDQLRVAYAQGQASVKLAAVEFAKTLFESAEYGARNRNDHWYVYDLYKTFLMRDPDASGWAYWESVTPINGRVNIRRAFEEAPEFAAILASIVPNGSPTANAASLITARVEPRNQPGHGMLSRDAAWSVPLLSLPGRNGLDLGLGLSYSSLVWTRSGPYLHFDEDNGFPSPGFRLGFPSVQRRVFDAQTAKNAYLLITASGARVELRQVGTSNIYESADSSYLQLTDNSPYLVLRSTDGTQLSFTEIDNEYRCTQVKDRNGNYLIVNRNPLGQLTSISDTLGRVINFNYDSNANLISLTQAWNGQPAHQWVSFGWSTRTMQSSFTSGVVIGTANGTVLPVITQVVLNDTSHYTFDYTNSLQVSVIRNYFGAAERNAVSFTYETPAGDVPRLLDSRVSARNWTGVNGVPAQVITTYSVAGDGACVLTAPDGTVYKEYYGTGWRKGLTLQSEVWSGGVKQKWTTTSWTQDNTTVGYEANPRVVETNVYDLSGNRRRTVIDYGAYAQWGLPYAVKEYAADGSTELRQTLTDYNLSQAYLDRRIIGLVSQVQLKNGASVESKLTYGYDDPARLQATPAAATQHDSTYSPSFTARGNVTSVSRWDVTDINNAAKKLTSFTNYYTTGSPSSATDPSGHQSSVSYADAFSDSVNRNTFAYPTTVTDADGFSSYAQYNFDFGATTRTQSPTPTGQTQGAMQTMSYNTLGQLERITTSNNGAYKRFWYGADYVASYATVNNVADELYSMEVVDGLGRVIGAAGNHPGSTGGYRLVSTIYNQLGQVWKTSNPTEVNSSWAPVGDDAAGMYYTQQTYDWKGRTLVTSNPDLTTKTASYAGCGCAGGEVVTLTDEGTLDGGVSKRRQQKIYSDVLGRPVKTEILNWQGGSVYSATVTTYNVRDQVTQVREYAGAEGSGTFQDTTMTYDGYGRLKTRHVPEQNTAANTLWTYNADDTINTITDARGAVSTYTYNNRHLPTSIAHTLAGSSAINKSFAYDAAGNRTSMSDGSGSTSYQYNQLSQLISESRTFAGLAGAYTLAYTYNHAGHLTSLTDHTLQRVNYAYDSSARLNNVTGTNYANGQFINNIAYRAWGTPRQINYGYGPTETLTYNPRLAPNHYQISVNGGTVRSIDYQYFNDGMLKFSDDANDNRFDRSYEYNHAARLTRALSGTEARGEPATTDRPYKETATYDEFGHLKTRSSLHWSRPFGFASSDTYSNNRRIGWTYDAEGNWLSGAGRQHTYDAAGRNISTSWSSGGSFNQSYDADNQRVKVTELNTTTYYLRSTVLKGQIIAELDGSGSRQRGYVYAGNKLIGHQTGSGNVLMQLGEPSGVSVRAISPASSLVLDWLELDPWGAEVFSWDPYFEDPQFKGGRGEGGPIFPGVGDISKPSTGCSLMLDGVLTLCEFGHRLQNGGGLQVERRFRDGTIQRLSFDVVLGIARVWHGPRSGGSLMVINYDGEIPIITTNNSEPGYWEVIDPNSEEPITNNPSVIDNSGSPRQSCKIKVSFSGSYNGIPNGPSVPNGSNGPAYGIGFSVEISGLSGNVAIRSTEQNQKPKGTWLIEQWVADFNFKNGEVVRQDTAARMDKLGRAVPRPRRDGDTVSWWDHPGTSGTDVQGYFTKRNFYIKAYNGERHCEVAFHLTFRVLRGQIINPGWGYGLYK